MLILLIGWKKVYFSLKQCCKNVLISRKNAGILFKFMLDKLSEQTQSPYLNWGNMWGHHTQGQCKEKQNPFAKN